MKVNFLILLLIIFSIFSCAKNGTNSRKKSRAKLVLSASAADFPGGVFVIGKKSSGESFSKELTSQEVVLELDNGDWTFAIWTWDGGGNAKPFEGNMKCDSVDEELTGEGDIDVIFDVKSDKCQIGPGHSNEAPGQPRRLVFNSCADLKSGISEAIQNGFNNLSPNNMPTCEEEVGKAESFKVVLFNVNPTMNPFNDRGSAVESQCVTGVTDGKVLSNIRLPLMHHEDNLPAEIHSFNNENCSGPPSRIAKLRGLGNIADGNEGFLQSDGDYIHAFLNSKLCEGDWLTNTPFADGMQPDHTDFLTTPHYICTPDQFERLNLDNPHIMGSSNYYSSLGIDWVIAGDIDFNNEDVAIETSFKGSIDGMGHSIKNLNRNITSGSYGGLIHTATETTISNLVLDNVDISVDTSTTNRAGLLIGYLNYSTPAGAKNKFENITIKSNCSISSTVAHETNSVIGYVGGVIAYASANSGTNKLEISNIQSEAAITNNSESGYTGGVVAYQYGTNGTTFSLNNVSIENNITGERNVGGIVGLLSNGDIKNSQVLGQVNGYSYVGGIAGSINRSSIESSYFHGSINIDSASMRNSIGGIVGSVSSSDGKKVLIKDNISDFSVTSNQNTKVDYVGGIAGKVITTYEGISLINNYSYYNFLLNGKYFGGIIGYSAKGVISPNPPPTPPLTQIISSASFGSINSKTEANSLNTYRGGVAGLLNHSIVEKVITDSFIEGSNYIGGAIGYNNSINTEIDINGTLQANLLSSDFFVGGAMGYNGSDGSLSNSKINSDLTIYSTLLNSNLNCLNTLGSSDRCGLLVGYTANSGVSLENIVQTNIMTIHFIDENNDSYSYSPTPLCFGHQQSSGYNCMNSTNIINSHTELPSTCESVFVNEPWVQDNNKCELLFKHKWFDFGWTVENGNEYLKAGNSLDPFIINNVDDWNKVKNDALLLTKSYRIKNTLDFSGEEFYPFGGKGASTNEFIGSITTDYDVEIKNIELELDAGSGNYLGVVRKLGNEDGLRGVIGDWDNPITFKNIKVNADENGITGAYAKVGSIVGLMENGRVHANVSNSSAYGISITESSVANCNSIGGLVGYMNNGEIANSSYQGKLNVSCTIAQEIGGLVGIMDPIADNRFISNSYVELESLVASNATWIGGLTSYLQGPNNQFKNNYVYFKGPVTVAGHFSGFIGSSYANTSGSKIEDNFVISDVIPTVTGSGKRNFSYNIQTGVQTNNFSLWPDTHGLTLTTEGVSDKSSISGLNNAISTANWDSYEWIYAPGSAERPRLRWEVEGFHGPGDH